jgi:hypothetical protein
LIVLVRSAAIVIKKPSAQKPPMAHKAALVVKLPNV